MTPRFLTIILHTTTQSYDAFVPEGDPVLISANDSICQLYVFINLEVGVSF